MTDLLQALTEGPGSRELSDRVLIEQRGYVKKWDHGWFWYSPEGKAFLARDRPDPTRNLQDAADGVPKGWAWQLAVGYDADEGKAQIFLDKPIGRDLDKSLNLYAPTPALALCIAIAALKDTTNDEHS